MFSEGKWFNPGGAGFDTELIGNSVWLDGSSDGLTKPSSEFDAEDGKEFTLGTWFQLTEFGVTGALFCAGNGSGVYTSLRHSNDNKIYFQTEAGSYILKTVAVYRDTGWYHILVSVDTTQSTNTDRVKLYINGIEATLTGTYPALNHAYDFNLASVHEVGDSYENGAFEGYLAQSFMIGTKSIQRDFAITDFLDSFSFSSGSQFGPKEHSEIKTLVDSGSDNSFLLQYENSSALGTDSSTNTNTFTATSMAGANQSSNTPSLVYPKISNIGTPSGDAAASYTMGLGSNRMVYSGGNQTYKGLISTQLIKPDDSPIYWEYYLESGSVGGTSGGRTSVGLCVPHFNVGNGNGFAGAGGNNPSNLRGVIYDNGSQGSTTADTLVPVGGVQNLAYEPSTGKIWFGVNGTWNNGSESASTTLNPSGHDYQATVQDYVFFMAAGRSTDIGVINFGDNPTFSGNETAGTNADENGHGLFAYAVPSGFLAPNSANVEPQTIQGVDGFITTLATESNIVSAVATARSDWSTAYVDILKNRSSIETWLYRFGDDSSNEFTAPVGSYPSYSATYQSTSSLSGTDNWLGYSIRIGADYLTAAGSASHSNGAATTVTHNLGTSRYCVLLFERGSTKDVWFHHPDFASGSLLKFVKDEALASSTQITTIGANSFEIGSGAATATYSYLVFADGGIAAMGKHVGNGVVNGPYISMPHSSGLFARRSGGTRNFWSNNAEAPGYNENTTYTRFNNVQAEGTGSLKIDMLASAIKIRDAYADQNASGETYYWFSFGELSGGGESLPPVYGR